MENSKSVIVEAFRFEELDEDGQERVFKDWRDSGALAEAYYREVEDIDAALHDFLEAIDYPRYCGAIDVYGSSDIGWLRYGNLEYVEFVQVRWYESIADRIHEFDDSEDMAHIDIAEAWNKHVPAMKRLEAIVKDGRYSEDVATEADIVRIFNEALEDVAQVYRSFIDEAFDYFYCAEGAREYWNEIEWEFVTADRWYDRSGRDITGIVDRYGRRC